MSHLDILLPFALPPQELFADLSKELQTPALSMLLARATANPAQSAERSFETFVRLLPHEIWLARQFGLADDTITSSPPIAVALMQQFGLKAEAGTWFIVQPVHIHIARDHLVLTDPRQLILSEQEAHDLFNIAKPLFEETGKPLIYGNANIWFVRGDEWAQLQTATPDAAGGHNIDIWMPKGPNERSWRKVQNEVQMHWHNHEINAFREAQGHKAVNSLWLWGGADSAHVGTQHHHYTHVFNLSDWMRAFSAEVKEHAKAESAEETLKNPSMHGLALVNNLLQPSLANDWGTWLQEMQQLEKHWFSPLLDALKAGKISSLSLILTSDTRISAFDVTKMSLRKFWVKPSLAPLNS